MPSPSKKRLILNVDDDEAGRYAVTRLLRQANFEVLEAETGIEALKLVAENPPDLILLDVRLPDIDGFEVCRRLKSNSGTNSIPVVHMTASFLDSSFQARGLEEGADGYLLEPVDPAVLIATVRSMLRIRDAERGLRYYANAWQATFDSIQDGIAILDSKGRLLQSNSSFRRMFPDGIDALAEVHSPSDGASLRQRIIEVEMSGHRAQWQVTHSNSSFAIALDAIQTISGNQGVICLIRDVTESNQVEENLRFTQKLEGLGLLASGIAHDFNNLLTGVLANTTFALNAPDLPDYLRPVLDQAVTSTERAGDLTRQLLAYAGKGRFFEELIDFSAMVRQTLPLIRSSLVAIELKLHLAENPARFLADATQIRQLLMNLIINASEAIGDKAGSISITTRELDLPAEEAATSFPNHPLREGRYVSLEVSDDGSGMDDTTLGRIFDPFFTTKFIGRGLGLSAVVGMVQSHKGAIRVLSTLGKGSYFQVVFPAAPIGQVTIEDPQVENPESRRAPVAGILRRAAILVIEDEAMVSSTMKLVLESDGHTVVVAENGRDGIKLYQKWNQRFGLVIVDLTMPVMGGEETIKALKAIDPNVNIVVCTGHAASEADELRELGVRGVIAKPFRESFLRSEVEKYLAPV